jgi:hypothetical protein
MAAGRIFDVGTIPALNVELRGNISEKYIAFMNVNANSNVANNNNNNNNMISARSTVVLLQ